MEMMPLTEESKEKLSELMKQALADALHKHCDALMKRVIEHRLPMMTVDDTLNLSHFLEVDYAVTGGVVLKNGKQSAHAKMTRFNIGLVNKDAL